MASSASKSPEKCDNSSQNGRDNESKHAKDMVRTDDVCPSSSRSLATFDDSRRQEGMENENILTLGDNLGPEGKRGKRKRKKKKAEKKGREKEKETEAIEDSKNSVEEDQYCKYIPLHKGALRGDWETAKRFFDQDDAAITAKITKNLQTALHVAVGTEKEIHFVEKLVELMPLEALKLQDTNGYTALHIAAKVGNTEAAAILVKKCPDLLYILNYVNNFPVVTAARNAQKDTLSYLLSVTKNDPVSMPFAGQSGVLLLKCVIFCRFYGE